MYIKATKGTVDQMLSQFKNRLDELTGNTEQVDSSFVYPEDLEDLENGEYESHMTEPINAASVEDVQGIIDSVDPVTAEVLEYFHSNLGWDITDERVQNYADAVAEEVDMNREVDPSYTLDTWFSDTSTNYPEEIAEFDFDDIDGCDGADCYV